MRRNARNLFLFLIIFMLSIGIVAVGGIRPIPVAMAIPLQAQADLSIGVSANPTSVTIGGTGSFTITLTNVGTANTMLVPETVQVTVPAGLATAQVGTNPPPANTWYCPASVLDGSGKPLTSSQNLNCVYNGVINRAGLPPNSQSVTLNVNQVSPAAYPSATLTVLINPPETGDPSQPDTANASVTVTGFVHLFVAENHVPSPTFVQGVAGQMFTVQVTNQGTIAAAQNTVIVTGTIMPQNGGMTTNSVNGGTFWNCSTTGQYTWQCSNNQAMQPNVAPSAIDVIVNAVNTGTYTDTVVVDDPTGEPTSFRPPAAESTATDQVTITAQPALAITKTKSTPQAIVNENIAWNIHIVNNGGPTNGQNTVTDTLQANLTISGITPPAGWNCTGQGSSALNCTSTVPIPASGTVDIPFTTTVTSTNPSTISNGAQVTTVVGPNNQVITSTFPSTLFFSSIQNIDFSVTAKTHVGAGTNNDFVVDPTSVKAQTWTVTIHNNGTAGYPAGLKYTDTLPAGTTINQVSGSGGATWDCSASVAGTTQVSCTSTSPTLADTPPVTGTNTDSVIQVRLNVLASAFTSSPTHQITNSGEKISAQFDTNPANDTGPSDTVTIDGADLTVTKLAVNAPFTATVNGTYTITVNNVGNAPTINTVTVTDTLPNNFAYVSATGTGWTCNPSAPPPPITITCTSTAIINANNGQSQPITLTVTPAFAGNNICNTANVASVDDVNPANNSGQACVNVNNQPSPDLAITKDTNNVQLVSGTPGHFFLRIANLGNAATNGQTTVTDSVPNVAGQPGFTVGAIAAAQAPFTCATTAQANATLVTCTDAAAIPTGATIYNIDIPVTPTNPGSFTNTANVTCTGCNPGDSNPANDTFVMNGTINAGAVPDLTVAITHTIGFVVATPNQFNVTVTNSGGAATTTAGVVVNIGLPANFTIGSVANAPWTCTPSGTQVQCVLNPGQVVNAGNAYPAIAIHVTPTVAGAYSASAVVPLPCAPVSTTAGCGGETNGANNSASDTGNVTAANAPDLKITKSHTGNFTTGAVGSYTITVTNQGSAATLSTDSISVTDTIPAGLSYFSDATHTNGGAGWTCPAATNPPQTSVVCTLTAGTIISAGAAASPLTLFVKPTAAGNVTNTVSVAGDAGDSNPGGADKTATDPTFINGAFDLSIAKSHTPATFQGGAPSNSQSYTLTVTNIGTATTPLGTTTTVTDQLDPSLGTVSASSSVFACNISVGRLMTCTTTASFTPNFAASITVLVNPPLPSGNFLNITNTANLSSTPADSDPSDKTANDPTTITNGPVADLAMTKTNSGSFVIGGQGTWTLTVTNVGSAAFTGTMSVTDTLPATNVTLVSATGTGWTCSGTTTINCSNSSGLAQGTSSTITIKVNVAGPAGSITNTATLAHPANDPTNGDENPSNTVSVVAAPPVSGTLSSISASPTSVTANGSASTSIVVTVKDTTGAPVVGANVTLNESSNLGGQLVTNPATLTQTTNASGVASWTAASGAAGTVTFTATANGVPITSNNAATVTYTVPIIPTAINVGNSSVSVNPSSIAADGVSTSTVQVIVRDNSNNPVPNVGVTLTMSSSAGTTSAVFTTNNSNSSVTGTTDGAGQVSFTVRSASGKNETLTFSASAIQNGQTFTLTSHPTLTIGSGTSTTTGFAGTLTTDFVSIPADNLAVATLTATVTQNGSAISGKTVSISATSGAPASGMTLSPATAVTDTNGHAVFTVRSTSQGGPVTFTATDTTDSFTIGTVQVTFTAPGTAAVPSGTASATTSTATPVAGSPTGGVVITRLLCTRAGPGFGFTRQKLTLPFKTIVTVLGRTPRITILPAVRDGCVHKGGPTWFFIVAPDGERVWANATYIRVGRLEFRNLPVLPPPPLVPSGSTH